MFIEAKDDGGGGDNWSYKSCKAPAKSSPPTNQHPAFLQAGCPSCRPTNSVKALKGKYHIPWTCLPQAHLEVIQLCLWLLIARGYLGGGLPCLSSALWCQYPIRSWNSFMASKLYKIRFNCTTLPVLRNSQLHHRMRHLFKCCDILSWFDYCNGLRQLSFRVIRFST